MAEPTRLELADQQDDLARDADDRPGETTPIPNQTLRKWAAALRSADEEIARLKDAWMEITAKAVAYQTAENDPERIVSYVVPCGPLHRAAGKLGYQMFDGEKHMAALKFDRDFLAETWSAWQARAEQAEAALAEMREVAQELCDRFKWLPVEKCDLTWDVGPGNRLASILARHLNATEGE